MTKGQKIGIGVAISAVVIAGLTFLFRYLNPGIYMPYTCNQGGDDTRKFYDPVWQARGAVCDGLWIPITANINGKDKIQVLAKMAEIKPANQNLSMKELAETAAQQIS